MDNDCPHFGLFHHVLMQEPDERPDCRNCQDRFDCRETTMVSRLCNIETLLTIAMAKAGIIRAVGPDGKPIAKKSVVIAPGPLGSPR